jgi:hypothetical protein
MTGKISQKSGDSLLIPHRFKRLSLFKGNQGTVYLYPIGLSGFLSLSKLSLDFRPLISAAGFSLPTHGNLEFWNHGNWSLAMSWKIRAEKRDFQVTA